MKKIVIVLLIVLSFFACEKDDICDAKTSTTPRLVIDFYDKTNPSIPKKVTNLKVIGEGKTEGIVFNAGATGEAKYLTSESTISIPLKTNADSTGFSFILNSGNSNSTLIDQDDVTFFYTRNDLFVSRACGFKTVFTLDPVQSYTQVAVPATKLKWMQYISIEKSNIDTENETHVKVFF